MSRAHGRRERAFLGDCRTGRVAAGCLACVMAAAASVRAAAPSASPARGLAVLPARPVPSLPGGAKVVLLRDGEIVHQQHTRLEEPVLMRPVPAGRAVVVGIPWPGKEAWSVRAEKAVEIAEEGRTDVWVAFRRCEGIPFRLRVRGPDGNALVGSSLSLEDVTLKGLQVSHGMRTDGNGVAEAFIYPGQTYRAVIRRDFGADRITWRSPLIAAANSETCEVVWRLEPKATITLHLLLEENGKRVPLPVNWILVRANGKVFGMPVDGGECVLLKDGILFGPLTSLEFYIEGYLDYSPYRLATSEPVAVDGTTDQRVDVIFLRKAPALGASRE